jgi:hypothetical protein
LDLFGEINSPAAKKAAFGGIEVGGIPFILYDWGKVLEYAVVSFGMPTLQRIIVSVQICHCLHSEKDLNHELSRWSLVDLIFCLILILIYL